MRSRAYAYAGGTRRLERIAQNSRISELNPAVKIAILCAGLIGVLATKSIAISLICLGVFTLGNVFISRLSFVAYLRMIALPVSFLLMSSIIMLFDWSPKQSGIFNLAFFDGWLVILPKSIIHSAEVISRALAATSLTYTIIISTSFADLVSAMKTLKTPVLIVELFVLIYRYITIIESAFHQQSIASETRLGGMTLKNSLRSLALILQNMPFLSFHKTRTLYNAMEARLYNGEFRFLEVQRPVLFAQVLPILAMSALPIALLFAGWMFR